MTKEEIAVLGHAFFDGKTLEAKSHKGTWITWTMSHCPDFNTGVAWRIKPLEPKTITICTLMHKDGLMVKIEKHSKDYWTYQSTNEWTHIKSLDQVVEVE